jgi:malonate transporter and related proteins
VLGVLQGFATITAVIVVGYLLARLRVLGPETRNLLATLVFFVATPCLLFVTLQAADPGRLLSRSLVIAASSVVVAVLVYAVAARLVWHRTGSHTVIGSICASYVNAGNLGIPLLLFVLGDSGAVASVMLLQLVVMAPLTFALLDTAATRHRPSVWKLLGIPLKNPVTLGSLLGLVIAVAGWRVPQLVMAPVTLVGNMAVPAALIAYGVSLHHSPRIGAGGATAELTWVAFCKAVVQPLAAWAVAHFGFGLQGTELLAATIVAALPTAQNVFVYAIRYDRAVALARDSVFITTLLSVPAIFVITYLLGSGLSVR